MEYIYHVTVPRNIAAEEVTCTFEVRRPSKPCSILTMQKPTIFERELAIINFDLIRDQISNTWAGGGHAGVAGSRSDKYANEDLEVDGQQVSFHSPSIIKPSTSSSLISNSLDNSSNDISLCLWTRETKVRVRIFVMFLSRFKPYGNKKEKNNKQWTLKSKFFLLTI